MFSSNERPASHNARFWHLAGAFSVMELVVLIALMGVLMTVAINMVGQQPVVVKNVKLSSDVATLNHMLSLYQADGGSLAGMTNPEAVLTRLKRARPQAEWSSHTGPVSGRLVDNRLRARVTSSSSQPGLERARWNTRTQRFEITTGSGSAVEEFFLDEALSTSDFGTENRSAAKVRYNTSTGANQGWVWGSSPTANFAYASPGSMQGQGTSQIFDPDELVPTPPGDPGDGGSGTGGGGTGGGSGVGGGGSGTTQATTLPRPVISPSGGTFSYSAFPTGVLISPNGAPPAGSTLQYRINNGAWLPYEGVPVTVGSADRLQARNMAMDTALYKTSSTASAIYYRLVDSFAGTGTGTWGNANGGSNLVTVVENGIPTSTFRHGNTKLDLGSGEYLDAGIENVLSFTRESFDSVTPNTWFNLGSLVMLNGTTFYDSEAGSVTLSVNLGLTQPAHTGVVHINLGLISTENTSNRQASADIVELRNPSTDFRLTLEGVEYRLELSWQSLDTNAGWVQGNQFFIYEGAAAGAQLRARFVSNR